MSSYTIEIDGEEYNAETASAKDQYQALHIAANSKLILGIKEDMSDQGLVLTLMSLSWSDLNTLGKLLVKDKVFRDEVPVGQNMFHDNPAGYALLVGKAARENLSGFFDLSGERSGAAGQTPKSE